MTAVNADFVYKMCIFACVMRSMEQIGNLTSHIDRCSSYTAVDCTMSLHVTARAMYNKMHRELLIVS